MKSFNKPRDINFVEAVRIDWKTAIAEAEALTSVKFKNFKDTLRSYEILMDIQSMYRDDNVEGYLNLLENNRDILKGLAIRKGC